MTDKLKKKNTSTEFENIVLLIQDARVRAFAKVNAELVLLYFKVGNIISTKVSEGFWGDGTVDELAVFIQNKIPGLSGFNRRGLYRMKQFYEIYSPLSESFMLWLEAKKVSLPAAHLPPEQIVSALPTQLQNTDNQHNRFVSAVLTQIPQGIFKDPYIFEFLDLPETHSEKDLEKALIRNLQKFILEVGKGFTYMGNQYRLQVGNKDYYTDLLFYHRDLQCLVLFELKIQEFEPEFLGKLNFYLEALDKDVKRPFEKSSIGILLCKGRDTEVVEYAMARNISPALVADYETKLIPKNVLANKLHQLVEQLSKKDID
ncbi:MAG: DUF1016 family protein [Chitinophagaceae bacterium]|nr:DUF1016 family protein [Chitinophagaceae bacterium]